jgi:hypothetical protein
VSLLTFIPVVLWGLGARLGSRLVRVGIGHLALR